MHSICAVPALKVLPCLTRDFGAMILPPSSSLFKSRY